MKSITRNVAYIYLYLEYVIHIITRHVYEANIDKGVWILSYFVQFMGEVSALKLKQYTWNSKTGK